MTWHAVADFYFVCNFNTYTESSYHSKAPEIQVSEDELHHGYLDTNALKRHLIQTAESQLEDSYLYSLYQAGQEWIENNKVKTRATRTSDEAVTTTPVCKYFLEGRCKFNERCHNRHPGNHTNLSTKGTDQPLLLCQENLKVDNSSDEKESGTAENVKKSRMRTATDVISRIQWDPELLEADFVVGYSDRFLGIIEKNFAEFCWEDISIVDQDTLAIPKHRIQYFKYKSDIVWDRRVQLDKFFGSRGGGTTIHDLVRNHTGTTTSN